MEEVDLKCHDAVDGKFLIEPCTENGRKWLKEKIPFKYHQQDGWVWSDTKDLAQTIYNARKYYGLMVKVLCAEEPGLSNNPSVG